jgi:fatty-acyl-CoA synthase/long-chain acyl-CoA synthetase
MPISQPLCVTPLADLLVRSAAAHPDRKALVMPDFQLTYAELLARARIVARGIAALGVEQRGHVGILANNSEELVCSLFGTWLADCVAVPLNARHKPHELGYIIEDAELDLLLTTARDTSYSDFPAILAAALPGLEDAAEPSALALSDVPGLKAVVVLAGEARRGTLGPGPFEALAAEVADDEVEARRMGVRLRGPAAILYTSGTTSNPKGCVLSHEALSRGPVDRAGGRLRVHDHDVTWGGGPLFHIGSLGPFIGAIGTAGTYVTDLVFDPGRALDLMEAEGVTVAWPWFPAIMQPILDHPRFDASRLPRLGKALIIAPEPLVARAQAMLPHTEFLQACGMTETAGIFAISGADDSRADKAQLQGRPVPGVSVRIVDPETGADLAPGEMGEIWVRGYCTLDRYHNSPDKTDESIDKKGWFRTGDLYERFADGQLKFCGRLKDMLKVGGENVAAVEVESYIASHPGVLTVQVVGRPDPRFDEVPVAFVEAQSGAELDAEAVIAFCTGQIARYKVPRAVHFVAPGEWPMSLTKIDKRALRALAAQSGRAETNG